MISTTGAFAIEVSPAAGPGGFVVKTTVDMATAYLYDGKIGFGIKIERDATHANDTMAGDARVILAVLRPT